jgi:predicted RNA-binding Zn-ribbon protein involved in translation (DUF1610 family)
MDDGDGSFTLELQAYKIAQNATMYKGSHPCPQCGIVMNPVEYMYSVLCPECLDNRRAKRVKGKMA